MTSPFNNDAVLMQLLEIATHVRRDFFNRFKIKDGKGYLHVKEELTEQVVRDHLSGKQPIAAFLLNGRSIRAAALDIDNHDSEISWTELVQRLMPLVRDLHTVNRGAKRVSIVECALGIGQRATAELSPQGAFGV